MISFYNLSLKLADNFDQSLHVIILTIFFFYGIICRMKMYEVKKSGRYGVGLIDPNTINEYTWKIDPYHANV